MSTRSTRFRLPGASLRACGLLVTLVLVLLTSGCAGLLDRGQARPVSSIPLAPCQLAAPGQGQRVAASCGKLTVPEDRSTAGGRQIDLNIAVVRAISNSPAPDALFYITGGPGQAATESFVTVSQAFEKTHDKRDIVLVDQRGTGGSHALSCPLPPDGGTPGGAEPDITVWAKDCLDGLDADPAQYTTEAAVVDLDAVRAALGYEKINLYGISYGTRVAQSYLRRYPDRVRTVVLDGVVAPQTVLGPDVAADAQRALDMAFARCAADQACGAAFPALTDSFASLLTKVKAGPVDLTITHPVTGERTEVAFTQDMFASGIRLLNYAAETTALLPLLIHDAASSGDLSRLAAQSLLVTGDLSDSISLGMEYSVLCAEDFPFYTPDEAAQKSEGTYLGNVQAETMQKVCSVWPRAQLPADIHEPVQSDVPVLLLSGAADPVTPPANAKLAAQTLTHSLSIVLPGQGHGSVFRGCLPDVTAAFVAAGSEEGLATACVADIEPTPFFVNFAGPEP
ncbi:MAG: alpha/beta fold hydrolase [Chloroflexota bacterium]